MYNDRKDTVIEIGLTDLLKLGWEIAHSDHLSYVLGIYL